MRGLLLCSLEGLAATWFVNNPEIRRRLGLRIFCFLFSEYQEPPQSAETMVKKELEKLKMELGEKFLNQLFVIPLFRYSVIT